MFFILISFNIIMYLVCGGLAIKGLWGLCVIAMLLALGSSWLIDLLYKSRRYKNNSSIYSNERSKETATSTKVSGLVASSALVALSSQDSSVKKASKKKSESDNSWDCSGLDCFSSADCSSVDCHHPLQALDCGDCSADCDGADCEGCDHPIGIVILIVVGLFAGIWYLVKCVIPCKKPEKVKVFTSRKDKKKNKETTEDSGVPEYENKVEDSE